VLGVRAVMPQRSDLVTLYFLVCSGSNVSFSCPILLLWEDYLLCCGKAILLLWEDYLTSGYETYARSRFTLGRRTSAIGATLRIWAVACSSAHADDDLGTKVMGRRFTPKMVELSTTSIGRPETRLRSAHWESSRGIVVAATRRANAPASWACMP